MCESKELRRRLSGIYMLKRRYKQPTKLVFLTFMHSSSGGNRCGFSSIFNTRMESILLFPHCFRQQAMKACFLPQASITQVLILPGPESPRSPTLLRKQQLCMPIKRRREHAEYFAMQSLQYLSKCAWTKYKITRAAEILLSCICQQRNSFSCYLPSFHPS